MDTNLFKAILAMDSYNRSYGEGIEITGSGIGAATIILDSSTFGLVDPQDPESARVDQDSSFYGIAYEYNGEVVISYRGTDDLVNDPLYGNGADTLDGGAGVDILVGGAANDNMKQCSGNAVRRWVA